MINFRIGKLGVGFSFWFFAVVALFAALNASSLAFYVALPILLHELGHLVAIAVCRAKVESIIFTAFGIDIRRQKAGLKLTHEIFICLAGIAANLLVALCLHLLAFQSMRIMLLISANIAVAIFNLLPIGDLDGGQAARLASEYFFRPYIAFVLSKVFSFAALVPLFAAAVYLLLQPERNFTLLIACGYLLTSIIVRE